MTAQTKTQRSAVSVIGAISPTAKRLATALPAHISVVSISSR